MTDPSGLLTDSAFRTVRIGSGVLSACVQEVFHVAMGFIGAGSFFNCLSGVCISKTGGLLDGFFWRFDFDCFIFIVRGFYWRSGAIVMLQPVMLEERKKFKKACILWKF